MEHQVVFLLGHREDCRLGHQVEYQLEHQVEELEQVELGGIQMAGRLLGDLDLV